jgi:hypothetical protein
MRSVFNPLHICRRNSIISSSIWNYGDNNKVMLRCFVSHLACALVALPPRICYGLQLLGHLIGLNIIEILGGNLYIAQWTYSGVKD